MAHHYDFAEKTKAERRERAKEKKKERMDAGKGVKLRARIIQERAEKATREIDERIKAEREKAAKK